MKSIDESGMYVSVIVPLANESADVWARHLSDLANIGAASIECILVSPEVIPGTDGHALGAEAIQEKYGFRKLVLLIGEDTSHLDAIRLGGQAATGNLLTWLNSDDRIQPGAIESVIAAHTQHPDSIIYGNSEQMIGGSPFGRYPVASFISKEILAVGCYISQPACWVPRNIWNQLGGVRNTYSLAFDHDLWVRAADAGVPFHYLAETLAHIEIRPDARSFFQRAEVLAELAELQIEHYGRCAPSTLTSLWSETLTPAFGYEHIPEAVLRKAPEVLARINRAARTRGDYATVRRLKEDMRIWLLVQGISAEVCADGSLSEAARICIIPEGRTSKIAISLSDFAQNIKEIAIIDSETQRPCRAVMLPHINTAIFLLDPSHRSAQTGLKSYNFLAAKDCSARIEAVF